MTIKNVSAVLLVLALIFIALPKLDSRTRGAPQDHQVAAQTSIQVTISDRDGQVLQKTEYTSNEFQIAGENASRLQNYRTPVEGQLKNDNGRNLAPAVVLLL
jgi:NADPH-dependent curcumin reductase CurA